MSHASALPTPPRLLLVEDSETCAAIATRLLRDEYDVVRAPDGERALELLAADPDIELVITDVHMPRLDGHELLRRVRTAADPRRARLPVIVMTTTDDDDDRARALAGGADDFVGKPLHIHELRARVRVHQQLERARRELEMNRQRLAEQAPDPRTGLCGPVAFADVARRDLALARRRRYELSLLLFGLNRLQTASSALAASAHEQVLIEVARILARVIRRSDTPTRVGGGDFAILLPHTGREGAARLAQRLRQVVARRAPALAGDTASAGIAGVDEAPTLEQLLAVANRRLESTRRNAHENAVAVH